jgi:hypothetical protein
MNATLIKSNFFRDGAKTLSTMIESFLGSAASFTGDSTTVDELLQLTLNHAFVRKKTCDHEKLLEGQTFRQK